MIRPLRQRHRRVVIALGIFLPIAFATGIAWRKSVPEVNSLPKELTPAVAQFAVQEWQRADLFAKSPVRVRLMREHGGAGKFAVEFSAASDFVKPDLMVYWVAGNPTITDKLPDNALLLGSFSLMQLPLSEEVAQANGQLVLFSLADNEIVAVSQPIQFNGSTN